MNNGPTGPVHPDWEVIQGEAYYVNRTVAPITNISTHVDGFIPPLPIAHPFPHCDCSACEIRRLKDQVEQLTRERDHARNELARWLEDAWKRGQFQAGANKEKLTQDQEPRPSGGCLGEAS